MPFQIQQREQHAEIKLKVVFLLDIKKWSSFPLNKNSFILSGQKESYIRTELRQLFLFSEIKALSFGQTAAVIHQTQDIDMFNNCTNVGRNEEKIQDILIKFEELTLINNKTTWWHRLRLIRNVKMRSWFHTAHKSLLFFIFFLPNLVQMSQKQREKDDPQNKRSSFSAPRVMKRHTYYQQFGNYQIKMIMPMATVCFYFI